MLKAFVEWVSGTGPDARPQDLLFAARRRADQVAKFNNKLQQSARRTTDGAPTPFFTPAAALAASRSTTTYSDNDLQSVASAADQSPVFHAPTTSR